MRQQLQRHASAPACTVTAVIAGLVLASLALYQSPAVLHTMGLSSTGFIRPTKHFLPVDTPKAVLSHYTYPRPPPAGFAEWLRYAQRQRCELRQYDHIERDLEPFRRLVREQGVDALLANLQKATELRHTATFAVAGGKVTERHPPSKAEYAADNYRDMLSSISSRLPDMRFVINLLDEPRVLLGPGSVDDRYASPTCANATADFHEFRHLHSFVISPATQATDANETLPVFSQTKIPGCHSDIIIPSHYNYKSTFVKPKHMPVWKRRKPVLFFRGSTTGGYCHNHTPWQNMHRQRLAEYGRNQSDMDIGLIAYIQCTEACCEAQKARLGEGNRVAHQEVWKHRFLMILDGNSFSSRLPTFLSSGSLLFRAGFFAEWFDERIWPFKHYLPVRLDFSDLRERLDWAAAHDAEAHAMGDAARRVAHRRLRYQDMQARWCYIYRLLIEYASLFGNTTSLGGDGPNGAVPAPPPSELEVNVTEPVRR